MPRAVMEFNLPEEQNDFKLASNGYNLYSIISDLNEVLKDKIGYGAEEYGLDVDTLSWVRAQLKDLAHHRGMPDISDYLK